MSTNNDKTITEKSSKMDTNITEQSSKIDKNKQIVDHYEKVSKLSKFDNHLAH